YEREPLRATIVPSLTTRSRKKQHASTSSSRSIGPTQVHILKDLSRTRIQLLEMYMIVRHIARLCSILPLPIGAAPFTWTNLKRVRTQLLPRQRPGFPF